jgi:hypothetical protein
MKYIDKNWDWFYLSNNLNITFDDIINTMSLNPKFKWEWYLISGRPNITLRHYLGIIED